MKKILYNYWGYLSDKIGISSPDGNFSYLWSIFQELQKRDWEIYNIVNRDRESIEKYGKDCFKAFSQEKRWAVYEKLKFIGLEACLSGQLPNVDLVVLEWRFPTADNQLLPDAPGHSPDLRIQEKLIDFYRRTGTPIIVFDLDYKLTKEDEEKIRPIKVLEQGLKPKEGHETIFIPFDFDDILQFQTPVPDRHKLLSYVGNPYNRDSDFEKKLFPFAKSNPGRVYVYGNWMKDSLKEVRDKNPGLVFNGRIGAQEFRAALGDACAIPLLATEDYKERGVMTMRILETLLFGTIPIGFSDFSEIRSWLPKELVVDMTDYTDSMNTVVDNLAKMVWTQRNKLRIDLINNLRKKHDASHFVDKLLNGVIKSA